MDGLINSQLTIHSLLQCPQQDPCRQQTPLILGLHAISLTNNIIICSRPWEKQILKFQVPQKLKSIGVTTIFNLQTPFQNKQCGSGLVPAGPFSYNPQYFNNSGIKVKFYPLQQGLHPQLEQLENILKDMNDVQKSGQSMLLHCHKGKTRTGTLVCCYLIKYQYMTATEAINFYFSLRGSFSKRRQQFVQRYWEYREGKKSLQQFESWKNADNIIKQQKKYLPGI